MVTKFTLNTFSKNHRLEYAPNEIWITNDIKDFDAIWPRSQGLGAARCYAFQCADVLDLHCETFIPALDARPWFVAVFNAKGEPLALFPFMIQRQGRLRVLRFIDGGLSDLNAPVMFPLAGAWDGEIVRSIWQALRRRLPFDTALFEKFPDHVHDLPNPLMFLAASPQEHSSHQINLAGTWEQQEAKLPRRSEFQRKGKRLQKRGNVVFEVAESPQQYDAILPTLMRQKTERDMEMRGHASLDQPGFRAYLTAARRLVHPSGPVMLFGLRVNDTWIATQWGYLVRSRFYCLLPSFEQGEWYRYSPYFLLADRILEWCVAKGVKTFDYGFGDTAYKQDYCDVSTTLYSGTLPSTLKGRLHPVLRKLFGNRQLPPARQIPPAGGLQ